MRMQTINVILLAMALWVLTLFSTQVQAWGQIGHRVTGEIAEDYLSDQARAQINALFPNESLAEISTYADENRSNPAPFWQKEAGPYHYVTVPDGETYSKHKHAPEKGDSFTALERFRAELLDPNTSQYVKRRALHFIVHIIADLHQPLHVGNGNDRGGNDVRVEFFWDNSFNLHRVWDTGLIDRKQLSYTEWYNWLSPKITAQQVEQWMTADPLVYINESQMLRDAAYQGTDEEKPSLRWQYLYDHMPTVKRRLQMAGVRIAAYLNDVYA